MTWEDLPDPIQLDREAMAFYDQAPGNINETEEELLDPGLIEEEAKTDAERKAIFGLNFYPESEG